MERCPVCRARIKESETCRRCGADLSLLLQLDAWVQRYEQCAVRAVADGDFATAKRCCQRALRLNSRTFSKVLLGFISTFDR